MRARSFSTRSPAVLAPAMVLLEVLVAAAILAGAMLALIYVRHGADADLVRARANASASALAAELLVQAEADWPSVQASGERAGLAWSRDCRVSQTLRSARLDLIECTIDVRARSGAILELRSAFARPSTPSWSQP